jgi:hypothetical protein
MFRSPGPAGCVPRGPSSRWRRRAPGRRPLRGDGFGASATWPRRPRRRRRGPTGLPAGLVQTQGRHATILFPNRFSVTASTSSAWPYPFGFGSMYSLSYGLRPLRPGGTVLVVAGERPTCRAADRRRSCGQARGASACSTGRTEFSVGTGVTGSYGVCIFTVRLKGGVR